MSGNWIFTIVKTELVKTITNQDVSNLLRKRETRLMQLLDDYKFKVKIKLCDDKYVDSISCECGEQSCKHMAACLHLLSNEEVPDNENKFIEIEGSLDNLKDDELTNFVKNQLISDYNLYKEFKEEFKP